jgi:hypothetical protein
MTMRNREQYWYVGALAQFWALMVAGMVAAVAFMLLVLPARAGAYATIEGPPTFSSAPGLPDGRVYEQVSPVDKNGNQAGATTDSYLVAATYHYGYVSPDGDAVLFEGTGPMGASPSGASQYFVATKNSGGSECPDNGGSPGSRWCTRALTPANYEEHEGLKQSAEPIHGGKLEYIYPSQEISRAMIGASGSAYAPLSTYCGFSLYLVGSDPFVSATWLEQPRGVADPVEVCTAEGKGVPVGGTPDFSTIYFTDPGTLLPEDVERAKHTGSQQFGAAWGLYEYSEGALREAGVLPNETLSPFGAVPADSGHTKARFGNQVSEDGERVFFVSPDPAACQEYGGENDCVTDPPQLYVREDGQRTRLISEDALLPAGGGLPAAAPDGPLMMPNETYQSQSHPGNHGAYVFASSNGAQAFFESDDRLTVTAPEGMSPKTYDFNLETGTLTYLPNVVGQIVAADKDGSAFAFVRSETGSNVAELDLWNAGPEGGSVTPIVQFPGAPLSHANSDNQLLPEYISEAHMSEDGSVLAFTTATNLSSAFNSGNSEQIYRYDAVSNMLGCVSCAPVGVEPPPTGEQGSDDASMSSVSPAESFESQDGFIPPGVIESRGISANGDRIFFETPWPLVPQDTNTDAPEVPTSEGGGFARQGRDVYEWENGVVYLISGGKSPRNSYYLDSSENGDDVFFATAEGLVPGDTDGGFDVYDARVPQPGDNPPASAVPCEGSVCQGPPRVQSPLAAPASATFSGLGNSTPEPTEDTKSVTPAKAKAKVETKRCPKDKTRKRGSRACASVKSKKKVSGDRRADR